MGTEADDSAQPISDEALEMYKKALESPLPSEMADSPPITELRELGLLEEAEDGDALAAADPRIAEARIAGRIRWEAHLLEVQASRLEHQLSPLTEHFLASKEHLGTSLRYLSGHSTIQDFITVHGNGVEHEMLTAQPGGGRAGQTLTRVLPMVLEQLGRGVRIRTLYQHTARFSEPTKRYVDQVCTHGAEVRTLDEFFDRMIIMDRSLAIIPAQPDNKVAIAITERSLIDFLVGVFDRGWQRAIPFVPTSAAKASVEVGGDIHNMIKRMLVDGFTDTAIARRIGTSERTYHNHLARIRTELGAQSRAQLGYLIARQELLE